MRTKVVSFFIFFQDLSNKKKFKKLRPKMTKITSRGSCLKFISPSTIELSETANFVYNFVQETNGSAQI